MISRQCFSLYKQNETLAFIAVQKLLTAKNDGRLLMSIREDSNHLVKIYNHLANLDLYIWPRISTNFIFENYLKNASTISNSNRSLIFMHKIPAKKCIYFNYDFIGTNHFPIDNINEQIFFMFALAATDKELFKLSPNMCRIFDTDFEIKFEHDSNIKLSYISDKQSNNRYINIIK